MFVSWWPASVSIRQSGDFDPSQVAIGIRMNHMAPTGYSGFDLYIAPISKQLYFSTRMFKSIAKECRVTLFTGSKTNTNSCWTCLCKTASSRCRSESQQDQQSLCSPPANMRGELLLTVHRSLKADVLHAVSFNISGLPRGPRLKIHERLLPPELLCATSVRLSAELACLVTTYPHANRKGHRF
ncbi:hypothetical protein Fuma_02546 [Fuerstiella marisgermanici]|uniref:Uncharacterized protein n=1 Tax=Fuerstiella marisgermanici TaxID=1891926 RepID=A0A1P8WFU6_9PLAN|nr:hypothetical protein Fuma_02546 [Fuerstiella marisgermanici]